MAILGWFLLGLILVGVILVILTALYFLAVWFFTFIKEEIFEDDEKTAEKIRPFLFSSIFIAVLVFSSIFLMFIR